MNKIMNMKEAISKHVKSGDFLFIGGYICRTPMAAIHEIVRQGIRDLTITRSNAADDFDLMIGAGVVRRFISTFLSLGVYGLGRCYRRSLEKGIPHKIEVEEYTNLSLPMMLMAGTLWPWRRMIFCLNCSNTLLMGIRKNFGGPLRFKRRTCLKFQGISELLDQVTTYHYIKSCRLWTQLLKAIVFQAN